jgi:RNA polymerase sigma-B factor
MPICSSESGRAGEKALLESFAATPSPALRARVIERHMPLARTLALRYRGGSESDDDLVQVANLGLIKAVDRFDSSRGTPFAAFAVPTILGELRRHFRDHIWNLRLPRPLQEMTMKVDGAVHQLTATLGYAPSPRQIAQHLGIGIEGVLEAIAASHARRTLSLDTPQTDRQDAAPALDLTGAEDGGYERVEAQFASEGAHLRKRELAVLRMHVVERLTQREIALSLGISHMQVSRISRRALWTLLCAVRGEPPPLAGSVPVVRVRGQCADPG